VKTFNVVASFGVLLGSVFVAGATEPAPASLSLKARGYTSSCAYYTQTSADLEVRYRDETLPWGSTVSVIYGFGGASPTTTGSSSRFEWTDRAELRAEANAPYTWSTRFSKVLHYRSNPKVVDSVQFVLRITYPSGKEEYIRGNDSVMGFYEASLPFVGQSPCLSVENWPAFMEQTLRTVSR